MQPRVGNVLTLGELEALACFGLAGLLRSTARGSRVMKPCFAEYGLVVGVDFNESAGDAEAESFGLAFVATAVEVDVDIVFVTTSRVLRGCFTMY